MTGQEAIKKLLFEKKFTQTQLCEKVFGAETDVTLINRPLNRAEMRLSLFIKMAEALDYEVLLRPKASSDTEEIKINNEAETDGAYNIWQQITANGETHSPAEWAEICGITKQAIHLRIREGMDPALAVTLPSRRTKKEAKS